jgi:hypothetical protein
MPVQRAIFSISLLALAGLGVGLNVPGVFSVIFPPESIIAGREH